jgi:peptidoglycan/LPS O-acetylase OafA/YrhL
VLAVYFCLPSLREFPQISSLWKFLISIQNINLHGGTAFSHAWSLAIEDQFYFALPLILILISCWPRAGIVIPCIIVIGGLVLRAFLAWQNPGDGGVSFRGFQLWIYYPTWTRLDPLVFGVALAAIEKFRPSWWQRLMNGALWLWLPGLIAIIYGLYLNEREILTVTACVWEFPLIAFGMAALLVCAVSPRLPFRRVEVPGAAFFASIAFSVYLSHKLIIHSVIKFCSNHDIALTSIRALLLVELLIYTAGVILFLSIERPFLQLRHRLAR